MNAVAKQLGSDPVVADPMWPDAEELALVREGKSVAAITHHGERTGSSLLPSKEAVDRAPRS